MHMGAKLPAQAFDALSSAVSLKLPPLVEVKSYDLIGGTVYESAKKTEKSLNAASGGLLFVDEAYYLKDTRDVLKMDALNTIMSKMLSGDPVVVFAGYPKEMAELMKANVGLKRRFTYSMHLPDYSPSELAEIFMAKHKMQENGKLKLADKVDITFVQNLISMHTTPGFR